MNQDSILAVCIFVIVFGCGGITVTLSHLCYRPRPRRITEEGVNLV
jgi:hypothetical protein